MTAALISLLGVALDFCSDWIQGIPLEFSLGVSVVKMICVHTSGGQIRDDDNVTPPEHVDY